MTEKCITILDPRADSGFNPGPKRARIRVPSRPMPSIPSPCEKPCIKVCVVDPASRHCAGCGRSLQEIERGAARTSEERKRIMARLPERLRRLRPGALPERADSGRPLDNRAD